MLYWETPIFKTLSTVIASLMRTQIIITKAEGGYVDKIILLINCY